MRLRCAGTARKLLPIGALKKQPGEKQIFSRQDAVIKTCTVNVM